MTTNIHPTAIVDPGAELGDGVTVGAYAMIEAKVKVGDGCLIGPYSRIAGLTTIGSGNSFESHCSVGTPPQDLKYQGEETSLEIGSDNVFREFVTLNRGTQGGGGVTRIGSRSLYMAYSHVGHDSQVGSDLVFANNATLAGHVEVADHASIGAFSAVHQFCRVGFHAFLGGFTVATQDCLPFMRTVGGRPSKCYGPNTIGLERKGFSADQRAAIKAAWRLLRKYNTTQAVAKMREELAGQAEVDLLVRFIESAKRGVILA
jgi:UDP-N-acetylglucosamine acyltransferase